VRQAHYRAATSGVLGGLLSLLLFPPRSLRPVPTLLSASAGVVRLGLAAWRRHGRAAAGRG
jgi:hypothetical protein